LAGERGKIRPPRELRVRARKASPRIAYVSSCKPPRIGKRQSPQSGALRQCLGAPALGIRCAAAAVDDGVLGAALNAAPAMPDKPSSTSQNVQPILRFDNLTLGYDRHPAVHHLHGEIAAGSLLAIVGPNGAGKSTLLKGITGELRPLQGRIELLGVQRRQIAYLTQLTTLDSSFPMVVHDFVAMGLWREIGAFGGLDRARRERIAAAIDLVGMTGLESRPIGALSGGQLQRAHFARVLLQDAPLVLLDEPYGAIDAASVRDLAALVRHWHGEGRTVISVLHDLNHVHQEYPETLLLAREIVARGDTATVLSDANLQRARRIAEGRGDDAHAPICHADQDAG
jgi:zinc/manganese transport system ATP-binding protein